MKKQHRRSSWSGLLVWFEHLCAQSYLVHCAACMAWHGFDRNVPYNSQLPIAQSTMTATRRIMHNGPVVTDFILCKLQMPMHNVPVHMLAWLPSRGRPQKGISPAWLQERGSQPQNWIGFFEIDNSITNHSWLIDFAIEWRPKLVRNFAHQHTYAFQNGLAPAHHDRFGVQRCSSFYCLHCHLWKHPS